LRIRAELTGGTEFDLGNSPREFTGETVEGKTIVMSTTNGTRALRACAHARRVLIAAFLNLRATADWLRREQPDHLVLVCSGTFEQAAAEDVLAAGALCNLCWPSETGIEISDSALMARRLFQQAQPNLVEAASASRNGQRLLSRPELSADVPFCLRVDSIPLTAALGEDGKARVI
jgi:2-phosphosulfolactate phosphatase